MSEPSTFFYLKFPSVALFDYFSVLRDVDEVRSSDGSQIVGDDNGCPVLSPFLDGLVN